MLTLERIEELKDIRRRTRADFDGYVRLVPEVWTREIMASAEDLLRWAEVAVRLGMMEKEAKAPNNALCGAAAPETHPKP